MSVAKRLTGVFRPLANFWNFVSQRYGPELSYSQNIARNLLLLLHRVGERRLPQPRVAERVSSHALQPAARLEAQRGEAPAVVEGVTPDGPTPPGMVTRRSPEPLKHRSPMRSSREPAAKVTSRSCLHSANAHAPSSLTLPGTNTVSRALSSNHLSPTVSSLSGRRSVPGSF